MDASKMVGFQTTSFTSARFEMWPGLVGGQESNKRPPSLQRTPRSGLVGSCQVPKESGC